MLQHARDRGHEKTTTSAESQNGRDGTDEFWSDRIANVALEDVRTAGTLDQMSRLVAEELVRVMRAGHAAARASTIALASGNAPHALPPARIRIRDDIRRGPICMSSGATNAT
jgi:hypothetical protein